MHMAFRNDENVFSFVSETVTDLEVNHGGRIVNKVLECPYL